VVPSGIQMTCDLYKLALVMLKVVHDREIWLHTWCCKSLCMLWISRSKIPFNAKRSKLHLCDGWFQIFVQPSISSNSHWCKLDSHLETKMVKYLLLIIIPSKASLIISNANSCEPWKTIWWFFIGIWMTQEYEDFQLFTIEEPMRICFF
jgi:hypothetical protein